MFSFGAEEMGCMLNLGILRMLALLKYIGSRNHVRYNHPDNHPSSFPCHGNQVPSDYDISDAQSIIVPMSPQNELAVSPWKHHQITSFLISHIALNKTSLTYTNILSLFHLVVMLCDHEAESAKHWDNFLSHYICDRIC